MTLMGQNLILSRSIPYTLNQTPNQFFSNLIITVSKNSRIIICFKFAHSIPFSADIIVISSEEITKQHGNRKDLEC